MQIKETSNIVQANYLIENRPKFTKDETRLFLTILGAINKDDVDFKPLKISVAEFADLWNVDSKNAYATIKKALRGLRNKEFFLEGRNPETGKLRFITSGSISMAMYEEGEGYATVEVSQLFKPYLLALKKNYTRYMMENILNLSTVNAIRNYELLKQYEAAGKRVFTVEEYKSILKIEDKYERNTDLRIKVLEPAVKEINANTDIRVHYEIAGRGQKAKIVFTIWSKKKADVVPAPETKSELPPKADVGAEVPTKEPGKATIRVHGKNGAKIALDADRLLEATSKINELIATGAELDVDELSAIFLSLTNARVTSAPEKDADEQLPGQATFDDVTADDEVEEENKYGAEYRPDALARFRELEKVIPQDVHKGNPEYILVINSILKDYVPFEYTPDERLAFMIEQLERFNDREWAVKKSETKQSLSGHYKWCLEHWLPENVPTTSGSSDDWDSGLPDVVLRHGMGE